MFEPAPSPHSTTLRILRTKRAENYCSLSECKSLSETDRTEPNRTELNAERILQLQHNLHLRIREGASQCV